ncbi:MAG: NIPSNAP family protein [Bacteroidota bacterium]
MKHLYLFWVLGMACLGTACTVNSAPETTETPAKTGRQYFQLKTYTFANPTQVSTTDAYLEQAFLPAMERLGIGPVGVFKNRLSEEDSLAKTFVLIPFDDLDVFAQYESKLAADQVYQTTGEAYITAPHDQPPYTRVSTVLMRAFEDMPALAPTPVKGTRADRVYELRSYEAATEDLYWRKVDMFNAGGEIDIFTDLGFNAVFYAEVMAGSQMPNLMYMTSFPNMAMRDSLWKNFVAAPAWETLKAMDKYQHTVSHADIYLLYPTEYSEY